MALLWSQRSRAYRRAAKLRAGVEPCTFDHSPLTHYDDIDRSRAEAGSPRFPLVDRGYDPAIVDQRLDELERELAEVDRELAALHENSPPANAAGETEFDRIGEQVSAILIAAHESADETTRHAQAVAERLIAGAGLHVRSLKENANREVAELQEEMASLRRERERVLADIRRITDGLRTLVETVSTGS